MPARAEAASRPPKAPGSGRGFSRLGPLVGVLFFAVALWLLHRELRDFHYRDIVRYLDSLPVTDVLRAVGLTALGYIALTFYDVLAFHYLARPLAYRRVALASFAGYAFSNSLGFPLLTGTPVRVRLYSGWGITAVEVTRVMLFSYLTFWLGFLTLSGGVFLLEPVDAPGALDLRGMGARPLGALFLAAVVAYFVVASVRRRPIAVRGFELPLPPPRIAAAQLALSSLDWTLAAGALFMLLPDGAGPFHRFLSLFLLAQIAGLISNVPAGLGVFETLMVLLLPAAVPRPQLLAALVAYRGVYYFLPLLAAAVSLGAHEVVRRRGQVEKLARLVGRRAPDVIPPVFAVLTFLGGALLLVSGATPAVHSRLSWLRDLVPLPVIEVSHFLGSLAGVGLLFLAIGLQRRLDAAYQLAVALLAGGVVLSLAKGLDWEEATILALMLAALLPCRRHFDRHASLTAEPFTPGWIAAIAIALLGSAWLGLFSYKHVEYSHDLWWHFTVMGNAPRFLRATVGAAALALGIALSRLLRPAGPVPEMPTEADLAEAAALAAASPRTYAYLALLGDKQLLFNSARTAFVMFGVERRSWVALGDPVGPPAEHAELAWRFHELADHHGAWTCFYQVSERSLHLYVDLGLSLVKLGEEALVPLTKFTLEGSARKKLRHAHRRGAEEGCRVEIVPPEGVPAILPELAHISEDWLRSKNTREKGFSLGFFDPDYLARLPVAVVRQAARGLDEESEDRGERIVAFANLWPGGEREELSVDLMRHRADAPPGVMDYLLLDLMLHAARQGYRWFNLGMAPLAGLEGRALAPLWSRLGAMVYRHGEHFYNFQGLRQYKDKFSPVWVPRYLACPGGLALPAVLADVAALVGRGVRGVVAK